MREAAVDRRERIRRSISLACVVVVASTSVVWRWSDRNCVRGVAMRNAEVWLLLRSRAVAVRASLVQRRLEEEEDAMVLLEGERKWSKI